MHFGIIIVLVGCLSLVSAEIDCSVVPANGTIDIDDCCRFPNIFNASLIDNCDAKYGEGGNDNNEDNGPPISTCSSQCVFNATYLINPTGEINQAAVKTFFTTAASSDATWKLIVDASLKKCFTYIANRKDDIAAMVDQNPSSNLPVCHPHAAVFVTCLYTDLYMKCPTENYNKHSKPACKELTDFVNKCAKEADM